MNHGALRNIRIWPDPDAVAQECSVLKHRARPREGTGLLENTWAPPYDSVVVHWALVCRAALSFFMAPHICFFFMLPGYLLKVLALGIVLSLKKEGNFDSCYNIYKP